MGSDEFWGYLGDEEDIWAEFIATHSFAPSLEGDAMVIQFGDADRLPQPPKRYECASCRTEVRDRGDAGWCHEVGFKERGGCTHVIPREAPCSPG